MKKYFTIFTQQESIGGIFLFFAAIIAMLLANSPFAAFYDIFVHFPVGFHVAQYRWHAPAYQWVNDGLMVLFFLLVGLEIKRELIEGELNTPNKAMLPLFAAVGGMVLPAVFYFLFNRHQADALQGWAIPTATDIAFSLAIFMLLRHRLPPSLKVFLTALAIIDDLGAILIIAFFYTRQLSYIALCLAALAFVTLLVFNRAQIRAFTPYFIVGLFFWLFILDSGIHATVAGVLLAFTYPMRGSPEQRHAAHLLEKRLLPLVSFFVLPLFAFMNAGIALEHFSWASLLTPISLGIILGLCLGKPIGIFLASFIGVKLRIAHLPEGANWLALFGVAGLAGIGFTMSLFIGHLAFSDISYHYFMLAKSAILVGSFLAVVLAIIFIVLSSAIFSRTASLKD